MVTSSPDQKSGPIIVTQTHTKEIGPTHKNESNEIFENITELRQEAQDTLKDDYTTVTDIMYNDMFGKAFVHMPDAVMIESIKTVRKFLREKGVSVSPKKLKKNPELSRKIKEVASQVFIFQDQINTKNHELEMQKKYFGNIDPEYYDVPLSEFNEENNTFSELVDKQRHERLQLEIQNSFSEFFDEKDTEHLIRELKKDILKARKKEYGRIRRKIAETKYLVNLFEQHPEYFKGINHVVDMAGGAGDLGIATADLLPDVKVSIAEYDAVLGLYADYLKKYDPETSERVFFVEGPLQQFEISKEEAPSTAFVAKHPCGGLKEDIVTKAIESDVPVVIMMTCCQDKMCDHAEDYFPMYEKYSEDIESMEDFNRIAKESANTNIDPEDFKDDPEMYHDKLEQRKKGEEAMAVLDQVTVKRLEDAGYEVTMAVMPGAHKGNVIMAKKKNNS